MKKVFSITVLSLVLSIVFTSCTDEGLKELEKQNEEQSRKIPQQENEASRQVYSEIDRGEIDRPGNQGGN